MEQSLEESMPEIYAQLLELRERIENHFRDVCELEFTIQEGRLFVLNVRPANRRGSANLLFLLQLLAEEKLGVRDVLARIRLNDIDDFCAPEILNLDSLLYVCQGLPASPGAATGEAVFDAMLALQLAQQGRRFVLVQHEISPEDIDAVRAAQGIVTTRGGMTSHAAVACRDLSKACVTGFGEISRHGRSSSLMIPHYGTLSEGDWITIDGTTGRVYVGRGDIAISRWQDNPALRILARLIDLAIKSEEVPPEALGQTWKLRDFFAYNMPLRRVSTTKRAAKTRRRHISFRQPPRKSLQATLNGLTVVAEKDRDNYSLILVSLADTLLRLLSAAVGMGRHHLYFRPLWDPEGAVRHIDEYSRGQMIGFEFFAINRYVPHLLDIARMTFVLDTIIRHVGDEAVLDHTNPNGESLVIKSELVMRYSLKLNDAHVSYDDLPVLFNTLRRREYEWRFYQSNHTTHPEIVRFLDLWATGCRRDTRLMGLCVERGLLNKHGLTPVGQSLVGKS